MPTGEKFKPTKQDTTINSRDALVKAKIKEKTDISRNARYNPIKEGDHVLVKITIYMGKQSNQKVSFQCKNYQ